MKISKFKKLLTTSFATMVLILSLSVCALAAQVDNVCIVGNTLYGTLSGKDATVFVAEHNEGLLSDVFFTQSQSKIFSFDINPEKEYSFYLWDSTTGMKPLYQPYLIKDGKVYADDASQTEVPFVQMSEYNFNSVKDATVVTQITDTEITGMTAGALVTYPYSGNVPVSGLSDKLSDVTAGSAVRILTEEDGSIKAIKLLATVGMPVKLDDFRNSIRTNWSFDESGKYLDITTELYRKFGRSVETYNSLVNSEVKTIYTFQKTSSPCYRVGIAMDGDTPIVTVSSKKISDYPTIFESTADYHNCMYMKYNVETGFVEECVYYCFPKDLDFGDDEYTKPFSAGPVVIIE